MNRAPPRGVGLAEALEAGFHGDGSNLDQGLRHIVPSNNIEFQAPHEKQFFLGGMWYPSNFIDYLDPVNVPPPPELDPAQDPLVRALLIAGQGWPVGR